jgi:hypothetical protein
MTYLMPPSPWILSSQSNAFVDFGECILTEIKAKRLTDHRQVIS